MFTLFYAMIYIPNEFPWWYLPLCVFLDALLAVMLGIIF